MDIRYGTSHLILLASKAHLRSCAMKRRFLLSTALTCCALFGAACRAKSNEAIIGPSQSNSSQTHPTRAAEVAEAGQTPMNTSSSQNSANGQQVDPFTFTMRSLLESDTSPEGARYAATHVIASKTSRALLAINRHSGGSALPIGLFALSLDARRLQQFSQIVEGIGWSELPKATGGDITGATLTFEYHRGAKMISRSCNSWNQGFLQALSPMLTPLDALDAELFKHPERALQLSVTRTANGYALIARNPGTGPIVLRDPRAFDATTRSTLGSIRILPLPLVEAPGFLPDPPPIVLPLIASGGELPPITLAAGSQLQFDAVPWQPPGPGIYRAVAQWTDYQGPGLSKDAALPLLPEADSRTDARPYEIRGLVFSASDELRVEMSR